MSPMDGTVDFHCHTSRSDGVLAPTVLYDQMRVAGLRLASITDHDTLAGFRELRAAGMGMAATETGPELIPAIEINSVAPYIPDLPEGELHILGFGVDPDDTELEAKLENQRIKRRERFAEIVRVLAGLGMPIEEHLPAVMPEDVASAGRPHLARALIRAGHATTVEEAFDLALSPGRPAYVPRVGLGPQAAIETIRAAGGVPSLAHFPLAPDRPEIIDELIGWGLAGLEVHYAKFNPETIARMSAFAESRGLLATGGTDYHGDKGPYPEARAQLHVPDAVGDRLREAVDQANAARA
ncbi:MAG TPA: PHP domain-containing protein [Candidatus Limnocylindrales bacterium]